MRRIGLVAGAAVMATAGLLLPTTAQAYSCSTIVREEVSAVILNEEYGGFYVLVGDDGRALVYEETNNEAGLQRGGVGDESCGRTVNPDTVIF